MIPRGTLSAGGHALAYALRSDRAGILPILLTLIAAGCDESLPPRLDNPNAISAGVSIISGLVTVQSGVVGGNAGLIEASVTNIYTEVLQDTPAVNIRCRIWLADYPDSSGLAIIDVSSLTNPRLLQNGMLTILPRSAILFDKHWNYQTTGGTPFWNLLPLRDMTDMQGPYKLSAPVTVMMTDTVRVFKPLPDYVLGPQSFTLQFEVR